MAGNGFLLLPTLFPHLFKYDRCHQGSESGMTATMNGDDGELEVNEHVGKVVRVVWAGDKIL